MNKYFEFINSVKILCGDKAIENIPYELNFLGSHTPLILSDQGIQKIGLLDQITTILSKSGVNTDNIYTDIPVDSSTLVIDTITAFYHQNNCDGIIAIGGGSVIDTAKGVRMSLSQNKANIMELAGNEIIKRGNHIPFVVMPTTCGTGSECTAVAVIKNQNTGVKMEFISSEILPDCAVIDVRLTATLPPRLIASTAMDALCHAIEAFSSLQKNPISDAFATSAMSLIADNLLPTITSPTPDTRTSLALASTLAGVAFSNAMVGIVHAVGHACGSIAHIPHGNAMAILLPHCMQFNLDINADTYSELLLYLTNADTYATTPKELRAQKTIQVVQDLIQKLYSQDILPTRLSDFGVTAELLPTIANSALNDGAIVVNNKNVDYHDIISILNKCL
ncbi:MAG: iron-containing alcohol dehydrogenase [Clostridia bacterium]|nr:iron-containing alcohol dehydrogenase [Clostridia bacterium]